MELNTPILITGAGGFIGKNLVATLKTAGYTDLMLFERDDTPETLADYAARAGFVFHLAGINRPKDPSEFYAGNAGLTEALLSLLDKAGNKAPVLVTSSTQAALDNDYGKSKAQAEQAIFAHGKATGAPVYVFRLPGVFGKWCRPNYNSVVASFVAALDGSCTREGDYCVVPVVHETTLGHLAETIEGFARNRETLDVPDQTPGSLEQKLYSTWLSYLPADRFSYPLNMHCDNRGSFTEFLHTPAHGQVSINISRPGIVKGNHWHHSKNEKFLVVKGTGVIRFRALDSTEVIEYHVSGDKLEVVDIPTGYTHNIENVGEDDMVTVMWANEVFDPDHPDTFFLPV